MAGQRADDEADVEVGEEAVGLLEVDNQLGQRLPVDLGVLGLIRAFLWLFAVEIV